jgi:hypothetical protein
MIWRCWIGLVMSAQAKADYTIARKREQRQRAARR